MTIRFACSCGQQLAARDEHAGKKVRCTACQKIVGIPEASDDSPNSARGAPAQQDLAFSTTRGGEDGYEDHPVRRKKKGGFPKGLVFSIGGVVLLGLVAFLVWKLFLSGGGASLADFDLVPRNAEGFVTVRMADLAKSKSGKKLIDTLRTQDNAQGGNLKNFESKTGLSIEEIERFTTVVMESQKEQIWIIVRATKSYDRKKVLEAMNNPTEKTHQDKKYHFSERTDSAVFFVDDRQFVVGSEPGIKKCLELPAKPGSGPLDDYIKTVVKDNNHIFAAGQLLSEHRKGLEQMGEGFNIKALTNAKSASIGADLKDKLDLQIALVLDDADTGKKAVKEIEDAVAQGRKQLEAVEGLFAPVVGKELFNIGRNLLDQMKPKQDGSKVSLSVSFDIVTIIEQGLKLAPQFGGQK